MDVGKVDIVHPLGSIKEKERKREREKKSPSCLCVSDMAARHTHTQDINKADWSRQT